MGSIESDRFLFFLSTILLLILQYCGLTTTEKPYYIYHFCSGANYSSTTGNTYQNNLNLLLSALSSFHITLAIINKGYYYNQTVGQDHDTVYGAVQCRYDSMSQICRDCVDTAAEEITQSDKCLNSKEAIIWYDDCMLRYSNRSFFSIIQEKPAVCVWNVNNITNPDQFNRIFGGLMEDLVNEAVSTGSSNTSLFATGETNFGDNFQKLYGLVQCTFDLSKASCNSCLQSAIAKIPRCCDGKQGGRVIQPSCYFRYEMYPFYESTETAVASAPAPALAPLLPHPKPPSRNTTMTKTKEENSSKIVIIVIVTSVITILSTITISYFCFRRRKETKQLDDADEIQSTESLQFNFNTIRVATDNFSDANKLGKGGFGSVYKGTLLDGQEIAVKRLSRKSGQGELEFKNEVALVVKLQHKNLVRLLGFCIHGEERLLVYEFMPNASLDQFIFGLAPMVFISFPHSPPSFIGRQW